MCTLTVFAIFDLIVLIFDHTFLLVVCNEMVLLLPNTVLQGHRWFLLVSSWSNRWLRLMRLTRLTRVNETNILI